MQETFDSVYYGLICLTGEEGGHWYYYKFDDSMWKQKGYLYEKNGGSIPQGVR